MAIKRVTIELDDSEDKQNPTSDPSSLSPKEPIKTKSIESTDLPSYGETESPKSPARAPVKTGRTFADLISEFANTPRAMATILMFAPFAVFVGNIKTLKDLGIPGAIGLILNCVWFGVSFFTSPKKD